MPSRKSQQPQKQQMARPESQPSRPQMPKGYAIAAKKKGMLPWSWLDQRLAASRNYWIITTRPDRRPHAMPVWGVWVNRAIYFGTDRGSRKARNLAANPAMIAHLESGDDVVVLEGTAREVTDRSELKAIDDAYVAKYRMRLTSAPGNPFICGLRPRVAFAWREKDFNRSATRWLLQGN